MVQNDIIFKFSEEEEYVKMESAISQDLLCIAENAFIAVIVTFSFLCVLFSGVIVTWGCAKLRDSTPQAYFGYLLFKRKSSMGKATLPPIMPVLGPHHKM